MMVLHYVQRWLPLSEQFVHAQVTRSRHGATVVTASGLENPDAFPVPRVIDLGVVDGLPARARRPIRTVLLSALCGMARARVVHAHFGYRAPDVIGVCRRVHLPLVVSLHGDDATAFAARWPGHYDALAGTADAVVVPSAWLAARAEDLGFPAETIRVIPSGVDTSFFTPAPAPAASRAPGAPVVAFVGRFVEKKGLDVLAAAWPRVRAAVPTCRLVALGAGPCAGALGPVLADGVEVLAPDPGRRAEQVRDVLRAASVVVTPSRTASDGDAESLLLVNLEAQACGRPVVTTRHAGVPEYVDEDRSALVVPENDPQALADALVAVLTDAALAARLGEAGPGVVARWDAGACAARVDDLYDELTGS